MAYVDRKAWHNECGAALLEFTVVMMTFLLVLFGVIEFSNLFYQWNAATKAVQHGARLAAVSDPVSSDLTTYTGLSGNMLPGDPLPAGAFDRVCTSNSPTGATGSCTGGGTYNAAAMRTLVYGRGNTTQTCVNTPPNIGMCNLFPRNPPLTPQNVKVEYHYTGLGYAGRPGGAVPTITVSLTGLTFQYVLLNGLVPGLNANALPGFHTTMTGEDLRKSGS